LSRRVKQAVSVPVATVGRVTTLRLAEDILQAGDADLVGMVRAHVADPALLPKSRAGAAATVRPCIGANVCINSLLDHQKLTCLANPDVGRPGQSVPADWGGGRAAIVVGAGPAGLEAARRLAIGGWRTTLMERAATLGGQMAVWSDTPSRAEFARLIDWWRGECARLGIAVRTGHAARADAIVAQRPDLVVIATGSAPVLRPVPGDGVIQTGPYDELPDGGHVLVRDEMGGLAALLTAERLAHAGRRVTLVTSLLHPGEGDGITTVYPLLRDLAARGIAMIDRAKVTGVEGRRAHLAGTFGEARPAVEDVDAIVGILDAVSRTELVAPLRSAGLETVVIGDAHLPRDVTSAVAHAARTIDGLAERARQPAATRSGRAAQLTDAV
jgi:NADPH-dependent 2,4-dienoyl-CoA reductase/sulfur reductase-like enzyme